MVVVLTTDDRDNWRRIVEDAVGDDLEPPEDCRSCGSSICVGAIAEFHLWATVEDGDVPYHVHGPVCWECSSAEIDDSQTHQRADTCLAIGRVTRSGELEDVKIHALEPPSDSAPAQQRELPTHE